MLSDTVHSVVEREQVAEGNVVVKIALSLAIDAVWQAISDPKIVSQWFGDLSGPLQIGIPNRLDFGDGDFFQLSDVIQQVPSSLQYSWRFLGTGPLDTINWHITPQDIGCLLIITDREEGRTRQEAESLKEGWLDFTHRLVHFSLTNQRARYDWRRELDGSIELPMSLERAKSLLFLDDALKHWLPCTPTIQAYTVPLPLPEGTQSFTIQLLPALQDEHRLVFSLKHADWLAETHCQFKLDIKHNHTVLSFDHSGWEGINQNTNEQRKARKNFCLVWIDTLHKAHDFLERTLSVDEEP